MLSEEWVRASLTADAPHLQPGDENTLSDYTVRARVRVPCLLLVCRLACWHILVEIKRNHMPSKHVPSQAFGYGFQWWLMPTDEDPNRLSSDFMAIGVYGQLIYVSPEDGIVIAKNAADPHYPDMQSPNSHENYLETQGFQALRAISKAMRDM